MPEFQPPTPNPPPRRVTWTPDEWTATSRCLQANPQLDHTHLPDGTRLSVHRYNWR